MDAKEPDLLAERERLGRCSHKSACVVDNVPDMTRLLVTFVDRQNTVYRATSQGVSAQPFKLAQELNRFGFPSGKEMPLVSKSTKGGNNV